ncbi:MAG: MerR family transcriptional regulator [Treponemataceae bacterium]
MQFKIGTFKKFTGLSEGTLRYYEKIGLITPGRDGSNDYRRYDEEDLLSLVQIKQLTGFHIPLNELLESGSLDAPEAMYDLLAAHRKTLEKEIDDLYERIARIKLHESTFRKICDQDLRVERLNIRGIYRLFISDPVVSSHPETARITARWLAKMPYTHATIRIPKEELAGEAEGPFSVQIGIGMLERYFSEAGETFREPMQYSPPQSCIHGMVFVADLASIRRTDLSPFFEYLDRNALIPVDDMFGWIVYIARDRQRPRYCLSLRVAVA